MAAGLAAAGFVMGVPDEQHGNLRELAKKISELLGEEPAEAK